MAEHPRFDEHHIHNLLADKWFRGDGSPGGKTLRQATFCPYYVELEWPLGADWGVIINPYSRRFGELVFEHDDCGCPPNFHGIRQEEGYASWGPPTVLEADENGEP